MKTLKELRKGDTERFKKDNEVIVLSMGLGGRFFVEHVRLNNRVWDALLSFNTLGEAKAEYQKRVKHLKQSNPIVAITERES